MNNQLTSAQGLGLRNRQQSASAASNVVAENPTSPVASNRNDRTFAERMVELQTSIASNFSLTPKKAGRVADALNIFVTSKGLEDRFAETLKSKINSRMSSDHNGDMLSSFSSAQNASGDLLEVF